MWFHSLSVETVLVTYVLYVATVKETS